MNRFKTVILIVTCLFWSCEGDWIKNRKVETDHAAHEHEKGVYLPHDSIPDLYLDKATTQRVWKRPLSHVQWTKNTDHMLPNDYLLGFKLADQAYSIPWWILKNHHIANVEIDGIPLVFTLCEMCSSANVFIRKIGNEILEFKQVGIYKGSWFMEDMQTSSYWLPFMGEAFHGTLADSILTSIPSFQVYWSDWVLENGETWVAFADSMQRAGHGARDFPGRENIEGVFRATMPSEISDAIPMHDLVLGVGVKGHWKAYSLKDLENRSSVLQDHDANGNKIVIFHSPGTSFAGAYNPQMGDKSLNFKERDDGQIIDLESGSRWNLFGECVEGSYRGEKLEPYFFTVKEWYAWFTYHPETTIFRPI